MGGFFNTTFQFYFFVSSYSYCVTGTDFVYFNKEKKISTLIILFDPYILNT